MLASIAASTVVGLSYQVYGKDSWLGGSWLRPSKPDQRRCASIFRDQREKEIGVGKSSEFKLPNLSPVDAEYLRYVAGKDTNSDYVFKI